MLLVNNGIKNIMIVTDKSRAGDFLNLLGTGRQFGARFTYGLQDDALGIADALEKAEDFVAGDDITVILGDNLFLDELHLSNIESGMARVFLAKVRDVSMFGVPVMDSNRGITELIEKPETSNPGLVLTGLYQYPSDVFKLIRDLAPSSRNELEITDLNRIFLKRNRLIYEIVKSKWIDAGTVEGLFKAQALVRSRIITGKLQNVKESVKL
jgi:glucose-1-phosphate thymidylyltransferase